jgi:site-specific DNA-methyltransferase (adenine-specific)/modification methylase
LNYFPSIEDKSIDLVLTDPPYEISQYSTGDIHLPNRKKLNNNIAKWDRKFDPALYVEDLLRVLKPNGNMFIFTSYNLIGKWHELLDARFDTFQFFVWHKTNPPPKIYKNGFLNSCELIICLWNKKHKWNFKKQTEMHNFFQSPICMGKERLAHPTQKPLKILKHLVEIGSNEEDLILDPFAGVGSTEAACKLLNRNCISIELDPEYCRLAKERIEGLD